MVALVDPRLVARHALCRRQLGEVDEALLELETARKAHPTNTEILLEYGNALLAIGESRGEPQSLLKAKRAFQSALHMEPTNIQVKLNLAYALTGEGTPLARGLAWEAMTGVLRLEPTNIKALEARAVVSYQAGTTHLGALLDVKP